MGVASDLYVLGMARGAEAGAGRDGRGKGVVEDTGVGSDDGEGLSGEESGPRAF